MTKAEFLSALKRALPEGEREQTLEFYDEMIQDRMEDGMTEEDAVAAMGDISALIGHADSASEDARAQTTDCGDAYEPKQMRFSANASAVRELEIIGRNLPVNVRAGNGDKVEIVYYTCVRAPYAVTVEGSRVRLAPAGEFGGFEFTADNWQEALGRLLKGLRTLTLPSTIEVTVPKDFAARLSVETSNGGVHMEDVACWGEVKLATRNGRVRAQAVSGKALRLTTVNGAVELIDGKSAQDVEIRTSNCGVTIADVSAAGALDAKTTNARIEARSTRAARVSLISANGRVEVDALASDDITLRTSNSRVSGTIAGAKDDYAIDSGTSNGRNNLPNGTCGHGKKLSVRTSNANIDIAFVE